MRALVRRVDAVVVASDEALWGTFDPDTSTVHAHGHPVVRRRRSTVTAR